MQEMLRILYGYQAWANDELFDRLALLDRQTQAAELHTALRLVSHHHVVAEIFAAHLSGTRHGHTSDNTVETPTLAALRASVTATDGWYQNYVLDVAPAQLDEAIAFTFTDGDRGTMTRHEMLLHVALHSAIHRGEVSRMLVQLSITPPWDTLAVYLHRTQPARRDQELRAAS